MTRYESPATRRGRERPTRSRRVRPDSGGCDEPTEVHAAPLSREYPTPDDVEDAALSQVQAAPLSHEYPTPDDVEDAALSQLQATRPGHEYLTPDDVEDAGLKRMLRQLKLQQERGDVQSERLLNSTKAMRAWCDEQVLFYRDSFAPCCLISCMGFSVSTVCSC